VRGEVVEQADREPDLRCGEEVVVLAAEVEHGLAAAFEAVAGFAGEDDEDLGEDRVEQRP
jgi:hypothetical protein